MTDDLDIIADEPSKPSIFGPDELKSYVDRALADIPDGKRHAIVAAVTVGGVVEVRYAHRINDVWQVGAVLHYEREGGFTGGAEVRASW